MNSKRVSVVIPAYNCAPYIVMTVRSALAQRSEGVEVEVIVVDDGSSDGLMDTLAPLQSEIRYIRQSNSGVSSARNTGASASTGEFVCFLDADDVLASGWFLEALKQFEVRPEVGVVFGRFHRWNASPKDDPEVAWKELNLNGLCSESSKIILSGWIYHHMLLDSCILCSAALIRRKTVIDAGEFEVGIPMGEDWDFWIRVSRISKVLQVDRVVVLYRQHASQATRRVRDINYGAIMIEHNINKWGLVGPGGVAAKLSDVHVTLASHHIWHALAHLEKGSYRIALISIFKALRYRPYLLSTLRLLFISILGFGRVYSRYVSRRW